MSRRPHGDIAANVVEGDLQDVDFLFPTLQVDPANLLPVTPHTVARLKALAATMVDPDGSDPEGNSSIPAAYTYLGQFVDHDLTVLEVVPPAPQERVEDLFDNAMVPMSFEDARTVLRNGRTATLDLDSVYGRPADPDRPPRDPANSARMLIGNVSKLGRKEPPEARPAGKEDANDLPRLPRDESDPARDRAARIGDPRNDENTIISQLHVAFLKAHNRLVDEGRGFEEARRILRQHYQHVVVNDFLKRVADEGVVEDILQHGNRWFSAESQPLFMPLEFTVAAFRFGHTMVRSSYAFNSNFRFASLEELFTFTALSGQLGGNPGFPGEPPVPGTDTLPENWIIEWENLAGENVEVNSRARRFDTRLATTNGALFNLQTVEGTTEVGLAAMLSARPAARLPAPDAHRPGPRPAPRAPGALPRPAARLGRGPAGTGVAQRPVPGPHAPVVLRPRGGQGAGPRWRAARPARQHARRGGADRPGPAQRRFDRADTGMDGVAAGAAAGPLRPGRSAALRGRAGRRGTDPDPCRAERRDAAVDRPDPARRHRALARDLRAQPVPAAATRSGHPRSGVDPADGACAGAAAPVPRRGARRHPVRLALTHLDDVHRWPEIFALNGDVLTNPNRIPVGLTLQLPPK